LETGVTEVVSKQCDRRSLD